MQELHLRYEGNGLFRTANRRSLEAAAASYGQGDAVTARLTRRRSLSQNALFHAMIQRAFANQRGGPLLANWEQLKGYLLVKVGWSDEKRISLPPMRLSEVTTFGKGLAIALRWQSAYVGTFYDQKSGELVLRFPRQTRNATREKMSDLIEKTGAEIAAEIVPGVEIKQLFEMAKGEPA